MLTFNSSHIAGAVRRLSLQGGEAAGCLNEADGVLGDGDLGITISRGWKEAEDRLPELPEDIGLAFLSLAKAFQAVSASSFGTLTATGLMSAASVCKGQTEIPWSEVPNLIAGARDAMMKRGKGELGKKSVLDILDSLAHACEGLDTPAAIAFAAEKACKETLDHYRDKPNGLGRARMFAERSVGVDDPGMLAVQVMVRAISR